MAKIYNINPMCLAVNDIFIAVGYDDGQFIFFFLTNF